MRLKTLVVLFSILLLLLACAAPATVNTPVLKTDKIPVTPTEAPSPSALTISIEYGILGLAKPYAEAGIRYTKIQDAYAMWENIEPEPGRFVWGPLDAVILEYQQAGFTGIQMDLTAISPWASTVPPKVGQALKDVNSFPKEEYLDDYKAYVTAVVERYDFDGKDDMPGLLYPIHDYGIEREFTGYWPGTAEDYVRLLRFAYSAIKSADPQARVLLVALLMADIFDGSPTAQEINQRLKKDTDYMRKSVPEIRSILAACDAYDIVDFHSLGNYTEIPLTAQWIRDELNTNGCGEKPLWIGDAFSMSGLVGYGGFVPPTPFAPVTLATRNAMVDLLKAVADPASENHLEAQSWLYAETAIGLVRKIVVSAGEGLIGINIGNMEDWKTGVAGVDTATVPMLGASMFMGLTDTIITNRKPGGDIPLSGSAWAKARKIGEKRPGFYALQLVNEKLSGYTQVEKLDLGAGAWAYRFDRANGPVWVMWYDDGKLYLPGETLPSTNIQLPVGVDKVLVTRTPVESGAGLAAEETIETPGGVLLLDLGVVPIFIQ